MRRPILLALAVLGLVAAGVARSAPGQGQGQDEVDRYVLDEMRHQQIPGLSIAVVKDGKIVKACGYGFANVELDVAATDRTIYQSGSMGKQFTAAGILLLAEEGRLSLEDRVTKYFPDAPAAWREITLRQLLTHTSGIRNYTDESLDTRRDYTDDQLVALAMRPPLDFAPGTRWSYSNTGYVLLGIVMTKVSGKFYGDFLAERVFRPLGMTTARVISEADIVKNRAAGYQLVKGALKNQDWVSPTLNTTADGSLYLSVQDMVKWEAALEGTSFLSAKSRREWWTPVTLAGIGSYPYGMGWNVDYQRGHRSISHGGAWQGFKTCILRLPDDGLTVIVLANLAQARPDVVAYSIAGLYEPALTPPHRMKPRTDDPQTADLLKRLMGAIATGPDPSLETPGFAKVTTAETRKQAAQRLKELKSFTFVGCDPVAALNVEWLGARIERYCYARIELPAGSRAMTFWITKDDRLGGIGIYGY